MEEAFYFLKQPTNVRGKNLMGEGTFQLVRYLKNSQ